MFMLLLFSFFGRITEPTPFLSPFLSSLEISLFWATSTAITSSGTQKYFRPPWSGSIRLGHLL